MSGFLVVTYTQEGRQPQRRRRRRDQRRDSSSVASMSTASTRSSGSTGATHYSATSVATAATNKKVFDIVTNTYVDPETLLTPFQRRLESYHQAQSDANRDPRWRQLSNNINDAVDDDGVRLFHRKRLDQWRLTYRQSQPSSPQNKSKSVGSVSDIGSVGSAGSIRPLLASPRFWGTVYQDIKIESTHAACDYFDVLPPVGDTIAFFTTVVDGVLAHVNVVSADTSGVTAPDELTKLRAAVYWYLADDHAAPLYAQYQQFMMAPVVAVYHPPDVCFGLGGIGRDTTGAGASDTHGDGTVGTTGDTVADGIGGISDHTADADAAGTAAGGGY
ncbi:hypothetical protein DIURU_003770 [Diutina rugosa]|uniref:Uncharacterized protein n=1 Tax=Diutina rugosa TaxID=5481 RepID=A0A642UP66_DIURU|nr:uncharacterized protein DIURU_003770 [Diutina rugosa]KAA8900472.1 hypothetical protein DIURU_003770 [Diutina rugosa]